jgi:hypothetical protein
MCGMTTERARQSNKTTRMVVVPKDGVYQVLCKPCEARYAPRCGFYQDTLYGRMKKLRGFK